MFARDRLPRQKRSAPAKAGRKRDFGAAHLHHRVQNELVEAAVEIATPIQRTLGHRQLLGQFALVRRPGSGYQGAHRWIGGQQPGEHRQQAVFEVHDFFVPHVQVQHAQKLAIATGIGDDGLSTRILDDHRHRHAIVRMPAQNCVDARDARGHLQVHVHAVVAEQHHRLRAFGPRLVDGFLHLAFTDAKGPVGCKPGRVGNRRVGKGLTDNGHGHAIHLLDDKGLEYRVTKVTGFDVLRDEIDLAGKVFFDNCLDALFAVAEIPMTGHDIDAQQLGRIHHVLALGPQRGGATLPGVAAVQQQGTGPVGLELLDQRGQVRKTADLSVLAGGAFKIEKSKRVGFSATRLDACRLEQVFAHEMGQSALHAAHAKID